MRLPDLLVSEGVVRAETVVEIFEAQALYGGAFDTNLLELGILDERRLMPYLERAFAVQNRLDVTTVMPAQEAVERLPRHSAEQHHVVPVRLIGRTLDVVCADPSDLRALDEIGFVTGCRLQVNVAIEARVADLLARGYGAQLPSRLGNLLAGKTWPKPFLSRPGRLPAPPPPTTVLDAGAGLVPSVSIGDLGAPPPRVRSATVPGAPPPVRPIEAERLRAVASTPVAPLAGEVTPLATARPPSRPARSVEPAPAVAAWSAEPAPVAARSVEPSPVAARSVEPSPVAARSAEPAPVAARSAEPAPVAAQSALPIEAAPIVASAQVSSPVPRAPDDSVTEQVLRAEPEALATPLPIPERPRSPSDLAHQLAAVTERDEIPPLVLGFLAFVPRVVLFRVRKNELAGWDAAGAVRREAVLETAVPLERPSLFATAVNDVTPYEGPLPHAGVEAAFLEDLGGGTWPTACMLVPILVKGRVVALLYADTSDRTGLGSAKESLITAGRLVAETLVRVILVKKQN